eukprot:629618-Prymnesium_polylepis.1
MARTACAHLPSLANRRSTRALSPPLRPSPLRAVPPQAAAMLLISPKSRAIVRAHGAFVGFTPAVCLVCSLTACGGLLIGAPHTAPQTAPCRHTPPRAAAAC